MSLFYRCWAGTDHPATNVEGLPPDAPVMFQCGCVGSVWRTPAVLREQERGRELSWEDARMIAHMNPPPHNPIVMVKDLQDDGS